MLGVLLDHFGEQDPGKLMAVTGRSGRTFFREAKTPEDKPEMYIIAPANILHREADKMAITPLDNPAWVVIDISGVSSDFIVLRIAEEHGRVYVIDMRAGARIISFSHIEDYDIWLSANPETGNLPTPRWEKGNGYVFPDEEFIF
ncbi:hypothetical protein IKG20_02800 [Candidatus Saccharibacteria bacterium]|nr:hypothetical protein [Candidatus Saccharibacteria bacterium]